jgi:predicted DNA-binding transcriptional regulator YafY
LTQKLLLSALYQGWQKVTVTQAAKLLNVSKMSITRCFDELEALNIPYLSIQKRSRHFTKSRSEKLCSKSETRNRVAAIRTISIGTLFDVR